VTSGISSLELMSEKKINNFLVAGAYPAPQYRFPPLRVRNTFALLRVHALCPYNNVAPVGPKKIIVRILGTDTNDGAIVLVK
jgi:hypothetical protein